MYKLIINNLHIGNYRSLKEMMASVAMSACLGGGNTKSIKWKGNSCFIETHDRYAD